MDESPAESSSNATTRVLQELHTTYTEIEERALLLIALSHDPVRLRQLRDDVLSFQAASSHVSHHL